MKKTLLAFAMIASLAAQADYLYWMVDTESAKPYSYDAVRLVDETNGAAVDSYTGVTPEGVAAYMQSPGYFVAGGDSTTYGSAQSFYVELLNGSSSVAKSASISYSDLLARGSIFKSSGLTPATITPASFGSYNVPEPTSGLLFLVGGMLLGLRRKRRV